MISRNALLLILTSIIVGTIVLYLSSSSSSIVVTTAIDQRNNNVVNSHHQDVTNTPRQTTKVKELLPSSADEAVFIDNPVSSTSPDQDLLVAPLHIKHFSKSYYNKHFPALQSNLQKWTSLLDPKGRLEWIEPPKSSSKNKDNKDSTIIHQFKHLLPATNDKLLLDQTFSKIIIEAHGDSTLRELVKFLVNRLKIEASLEKKDANMTFRAPKFFSLKYSVPEVDGDAEKLLRVSFRFDFFGESFLERYQKSNDEVPSLNSLFGKKRNDRTSGKNHHFGKSFFDDTKANIVLLSVGSHIAKTLIMEKKITDPKRLMNEGIMKSIIYPIQDFILWRCLGIEVDRGSKNDGYKLIRRRTQGSTNDDKSTFFKPSPTADLIIFFMQSVECEAMAQSQLTGFRNFAKICPAVQKFLEQLHDTMVSEISDVVLLEKSTTKESSKNGNNVLRDASLTEQERTILRGRFLYVAPMHCNSGGKQSSSTDSSASLSPYFSTSVVPSSIKAALTPSKPHCSRDGIHLRSKFLRLKLDLFFNVIVSWWKMV